MSDIGELITELSGPSAAVSGHQNIISKPHAGTVLSLACPTFGLVEHGYVCRLCPFRHHSCVVGACIDALQKMPARGVRRQNCRRCTGSQSCWS